MPLFNSTKALALATSAILLLFFACRKLDYVNSVSTPQSQAQKFYSLPANASPALKRIAQKIKDEDIKANFLSSFIRREGYPLWSKAVISYTTKLSPASRGTTGEAGDTLLVIPLVLEGEEKVNAFIEATVSDSISMAVYNSGAYEQKSFSCVTDTASAENYALRFMLLDNSVFGYTKFRVTDERLFSCLSPNVAGTESRVLEIRNRQPDPAGRFTLEIVTVCLNNYHCTNVPEYCSPRCDLCDQCFSQACLDFEVDSWYSEDGGGGGGSSCRPYGTIGGGGCSPGGGGDDDPPGWEPYEFEDDDNIPAHIDNVIDSISNPCLKETLNHLMAGEFQNTVSNILVNIFGASTDCNLRFVEVFDLASNVDARSNHIGWSSTGGYLIRTKLNGNVLPNASKEYTAQTIYHETIHGYLIAGGMTDPLIHHNHMAVAFSNQLQVALVDAYPNINPLDAKALSWAGLQATNAWDSINTNHPSEATDILVRISKHRVATSGTPCQ
ncbi:MAG: 4Fe-4S dicluster protein [Flaviaesturariibacter sp.]|nr:4Fe-4S dicluster protein [Flaviaesturariibacter sp.]